MTANLTPAQYAALMAELGAALKAGADDTARAALSSVLPKYVTVTPDPGPTDPPPAAGVTVRGTQLLIDGVPRQVAGWNLFGATGCHQQGRRYSDALLDRFFHSLPPRNLTRCWGFRPQGFDNLKAVADRAAHNQQLLIVSLGDGVSHCGDTEGSPGQGKAKSPDWYKAGYRANYRPWVDRVTRELAGHPGIGGWEPMNEPIGQTGAVLRAFNDDIGGLIHRNDPGRPVFSGQRGIYDFGDGMAGWKLAHASPGIDVTSMHTYDFEHQASRRIVSGWWGQTIQASRDLGKPCVLGEVGIGVPGKTGATRESRAVAMRDTIRQCLDAGAAGVFVWNRYLAESPEGYAVDTWDDPLIAVVRGESR